MPPEMVSVVFFAASAVSPTALETLSNPVSVAMPML